MPVPCPAALRRGTPPGRGAALTRVCRALAREQGGFTLIEVLASAFILVLVAVGALAGLDAITRESFQSRVRTDAQALAEQDQQRMRSMTIDQLTNLNQALSPVTLDGVQFTVTEQASFVGDASQTAPTCTNPSTDYLKLTTRVTWTNMGTDTPVIVNGIDTPPVATLVAHDQGGLRVTTGQAGTTVTVIGPSGSSPTTTTTTADSTGCALFSSLTPGTYTVDAYSYGPTFVDTSTGQVVTTTKPDTATAGVVGGSVATTSLPLATPGSIAVSWATSTAAPVAVTASNNTLNPNHLLVCTKADLSSASACPAVGQADTEFPYTDIISGGATFTDPTVPPLTSAYTVYAGTCANNEPAFGSNGGTDQTATVTAGGQASVKLTTPAINLQVWSGSSSSKPGSRVKPTNVYLKDTGCSVRYTGYYTTPSSSLATGQNPELAQIPLKSNYTSSPSTGLLADPGMPYGTYNVCVDLGSSTYWSATAQLNGNSGVTVNVYTGATGSTSGELTTC